MSDTLQVNNEPARAFSVLEQGLLALREGRLDIGGVMWTLAASTVYVGTPDAPAEDGTITGTYIVSNEAGASLLPLFTQAELAQRFFDTPYAVVAEVTNLLSTMPPEAGIVVNPGEEMGFEIPAESVQTLRGELRLP
jgi:hypothetical protein